MKATHLDLLRCGLLRGEGAHFCIKHMPDVERVVPSNARRFDVGEHFSRGGDLKTSRLEHLDVAACPRLDNSGIKRLVTKLEGRRIRHLDFSCCSGVIDGR